MFSEVIRETELTDRLVRQELFPHIFSDFYVFDESLLSTACAIVAPRMEDDEKILVMTDQVHYSEQFADFSKFSLYNTLAIYRIPNSDTYDYMEKNFVPVAEDNGFSKVKKVTGFFKNNFKVTCLVNPSIKSSVVFCENIHLESFHYLQCAIIAMLPWYFKPEDGLSENELKLLESLRKNSCKDYLQCIKDIADELKVEDIRVKKMLDGFELSGERRTLSRMNSEYERVTTEINDYTRFVQEKISRKKEIALQMNTLQAKIASGASGENAILGFFLDNKNVRLMSASEQGELMFQVYGYLDSFDDIDAENYINNKDSVLYCNFGDDYTSRISKSDKELFWKALFIDKTIKGRFTCAYRLDVDPYSVRGLSTSNVNYVFDDHMPNPHVNHYNCLGDYNQAIISILENSANYVAAVCQCVASNGSLNIGDYPVMEKFVVDVFGGGFGSRNKWVELPDGTCETTRGAIKYLLEHNKQDEQENLEVNDNE